MTGITFGMLCEMMVQKVAGGWMGAVTPVVSLESGVKINTSLAGNGSEDTPWTLTK